VLNVTIRRFLKPLTFAILGSVVLAAKSSATEQTAMLSVPASAILFSGEGMQPPDDEGHFAIGIKLPQPKLKARNCDTETLIVGMGSLNKPKDELSPADRKIVAADKAYYDSLVAAAKQGGTINIPVRNQPDYLKIANGVIVASYCLLSIDEGRVP
jgi:hypothetical protein